MLLLMMPALVLMLLGLVYPTCAVITYRYLLHDKRPITKILEDI